MTTPDEAMQVEMIKKTAMRKILTKEALERLGRVKIANSVLASQLEAYLIQVYQSGQLKEQIDDPKLKQILGVLTNESIKKIKIKRR